MTQKAKRHVPVKLLARLSASPGRVFSISDLLNLGPRTAVAQALVRLTQDNKVRRIGRGLYEVPQFSTILNGPVPASSEEVARAWARKNRLQLIPSGAYAANLLGLSTQVPAKMVYYTNGRTKQVEMGPYTFKVLGRGPKTMDVQGRISSLLFPALRYMGKDGMTPDLVTSLRSKLSQKDKDEIKHNLNLAPAWMKSLLQQIIERKKR